MTTPQDVLLLGVRSELMATTYRYLLEVSRPSGPILPCVYQTVQFSDLVAAIPREHKPTANQFWALNDFTLKIVRDFQAVWDGERYHLPGKGNVEVVNVTLARAS